MMDVASLFSLVGRTAVVTGASRGIGYAIAEGLAEAGAHVVALARSPAPDQPFGSNKVEYRSADVIGDLSCVFGDALSPGSSLDILVNAAGISLSGADVGGERECFDRTVRVNLSAAYAACLAARPFMRHGGSIVNVTSIGSMVGFPGNPGYVASKGGLRMMTKALAVDYGTLGIRVNALVPGYIHTSMTAKSFEDPALHEQRRRHTCLGRWGAIGDLVGAAVFLASDASRYVTGHDLVVDGGWTAKGLV